MFVVVYKEDAFGPFATAQLADAWGDWHIGCKCLGWRVIKLHDSSVKPYVK